MSKQMHNSPFKFFYSIINHSLPSSAMISLLVYFQSYRIQLTFRQNFLNLYSIINHSLPSSAMISLLVGSFYLTNNCGRDIKQENVIKRREGGVTEDKQVPSTKIMFKIVPKYYPEPQKPERRKT